MICVFITNKFNKPQHHASLRDFLKSHKLCLPSLKPKWQTHRHPSSLLDIPFTPSSAGSLELVTLEKACNMIVSVFSYESVHFLIASSAFSRYSFR